MKDYLDQFSRKQIIAALIVIAAALALALAYIFGGMLGVKVIFWAGVTTATIIGIVLAFVWMIDYLQMREWEEERDRKGGKR